MYIVNYIFLLGVPEGNFLACPLASLHYATTKRKISFGRAIRFTPLRFVIASIPNALRKQSKKIAYSHFFLKSGYDSASTIAIIFYRREKPLSVGFSPEPSFPPK